MDGAKSSAPNRGRLGHPWVWLVVAGVWLFYLVYPITQFASRAHPWPIPLAGLGSLILFVAVYLSAWLKPPGVGDRAKVWAAWGLVAISLLVFYGLHVPDALGGLVYVGPVIGVVGWRRTTAVILAVVTAAFAVALAWNHVPLGESGFSFMLPFYVVTFGMLAYGHAWRLGVRLRLAEDEVRRLAAANERLELARDLHDVIGHSLSVLALRSELAAQQADGAAPDAAQEMRQIAELARQALHDIRLVVSRRREASFRAEWLRARATLAAAGITAEDAGLDRPLPPELDRVMAYWVREGVTNILRHSNATRCRLTCETQGNGMTITLEDNGLARAPAVTAQSGWGLSGLRERLAPFGGRVEVQRLDTGFCLRAVLPATPSSADPTMSSAAGHPAALAGEAHDYA
jgi:two-component system sensor histidine kinase DesK